MRVKLDEEAASRIQKEQDELLQKDAEASKRAVEVLAELETERDLRRRAEESSAALQQWANQDAEEISQLHGERDELCRTEERLRSERSTAHEERDQAIRERGEARREAMALWADLGDKVARRLEAEEVSAELGMELGEVRGILQAESDQHDLFCAAVVVVCDDL